MLTPEEYVKKSGFICPLCQCEDVVGHSIETGNGTELYQDVTCSGCNASWTDVYRLVGYECFETPIVNPPKMTNG